MASISPTQYVGLIDCALRTVWATNRVPPLLPLGPSARVGTATHQLLQEAGEGRFTNENRSLIEPRWEQLIRVSEEVMNNSWLERHLTPLKNSVRDYEVRRIQAVERANELSLAREAYSVDEIQKRPTDVLGLEVDVSSKDRLVKGRIDAVLALDDGILIRDYKSGAVFERVERGFPRSLKLAYEIQLKLYAALYEEETGEWPFRLEIVPILGGPLAVEFDWEEARNLLREARIALQRVNSNIAEADTSEEKQARLARPGASICAFCPYRPGCKPYREARKGEDWPRDLWGLTVELKMLENQTSLLTLALDDGTTVRIRGLSPRPDRHPALRDLAPGEYIGAFNLRGSASPQAFIESPGTTLYKAGRSQT